MNDQVELTRGAGRTEDVRGLGLDVRGWDSERSARDIGAWRTGDQPAYVGIVDDV